MAFGSMGGEEGGPVADINVTPLFERGIDVNLPQTVSSNISGQERVILTIPKDKNYVYFNSQPVNRKLMKGYLEQIFSKRKDKTVYLFADKSVPYGEVLHVMDEVKQAGIQTVGLATEPPSNNR
ncbi:MAG: biopolymer transporter ExbD [Acidobacteriota bacterium]